MSKVFSGIGKAVGGLMKGVTKVFKAVTKSGFGKALLLAGAIYLGGAALGMWESPFTSINGILSQAPPVAEVAAGPSQAWNVLANAPATTMTDVGLTAAEEAARNAATMSSGSPAAVELATQGAAMPSGVGLKTPALGPEIAGGGPYSVGGANYSAGLNLNPAATTGRLASMTSTTSPGIISQAMQGLKDVGAWVQKNPIPSIIGGQMLTGMMTPDVLDALREKARLGDQEAQRQLAEAERNQRVGGVRLGVQPHIPPVALRRPDQGLVYDPVTGQPIIRPRMV